MVYFGTLSKVLAPGLRIAFAVAPPPVIDRISAYRRFVDVQGDQILERAICDLLEDGEMDRHIRRMVRIGPARCAALRTELPMLRFMPPAHATILRPRHKGPEPAGRNTTGVFYSGT